MKKTTHTRAKNIVAVAVLGFVLTALSGSSDFANAQLSSNLGNLNASQQVTQAIVPGTNLRNDLNTRLSNWRSSNQVLINGVLKDVIEGDIINLSTDTPNGGPGTQPLPKFSRGLNTPVILNERGAVQITDDAVIHGFVDIHGGIANYDQEGMPVGNDNGGELDQPVYIFDDVAIRSGTPGSSGSLNVSGAIVGGAVGQLHQFTGDVRMISGNVNIGGPLTIENNVVNALPTVIKGPLNIGYGVTRIFGDTVVFGPNPVDLNAPHQTKVNIEGSLTIGATPDRVLDGSATKLPDTPGALQAESVFANQIGLVTSQVSANGPTNVSLATWTALNPVVCPNATDIVLSCQAEFLDAGGIPEAALEYTYATGNTCTAKAKKTNAAAPNFNVRARALCWDRNGPGR